jgi:hypothetical protein
MSANCLLPQHARVNCGPRHSNETIITRVYLHIQNYFPYSIVKSTRSNETVNPGPFTRMNISKRDKAVFAIGHFQARLPIQFS